MSGDTVMIHAADAHALMSLLSDGPPYEQQLPPQHLHDQHHQHISSQQNPSQQHSNLWQQQQQYPPHQPPSHQNHQHYSSQQNSSQHHHNLHHQQQIYPHQQPPPPHPHSEITTTTTTTTTAEPPKETLSKAQKRKQMRFRLSQRMNNVLCDYWGWQHGKLCCGKEEATSLPCTFSYTHDPNYQEPPRKKYYLSQLPMDDRSDVDATNAAAFAPTHFPSDHFHASLYDPPHPPHLAQEAFSLPSHHPIHHSTHFPAPYPTSFPTSSSASSSISLPTNNHQHYPLQDPPRPPNHIPLLPPLPPLPVLEHTTSTPRRQYSERARQRRNERRPRQRNTPTADNSDAGAGTNAGTSTGNSVSTDANAGHVLPK